MATTVVIGIDTGGTFTDLVAIAGGRLRVHKVLSTPDDPARAVITGLKAMLEGAPHDRNRDLLPDLGTYTSTVATNALPERKRAPLPRLTNPRSPHLLHLSPPHPP